MLSVASVGGTRLVCILISANAITLSALVPSCAKSFHAECHQTTLGTMPFSDMTLSIMILCLYAECRAAAERGGGERDKTNCFLSLFLKIKMRIKS